MALVARMKQYVNENLAQVITGEQVVRICVDLDFDEAKINNTLRSYETDSKYKGLDAYEWSTAMSRADKKAEKKAQADAMKEERRIN